LLLLVHLDDINFTHRFPYRSSDIQQATNMARAMVTKYGFSEDVGIVFYGEFCCVILVVGIIALLSDKLTQHTYDYPYLSHHRW